MGGKKMSPEEEKRQLQIMRLKQQQRAYPHKQISAQQQGLNTQGEGINPQGTQPGTMPGISGTMPGMQSELNGTPGTAFPTGQRNGGTLPAVAAEPRIGKEDVRQATETLQKYKQGKANLESRVIANEQWWKLRNWEQIGASKNTSDPQPSSAWLFNSISNKHADAMDNFPQPNVLPREDGDRKEAQILSSVLPVILEQNEYEQTYSDLWWAKLIGGTAVTGVFWNNGKDNGLGDIDIKQIDILSLFWQPGIRDIQQSRNVFNIELIDNDVLEEMYPDLKGKLGTSSIQVSEYIYDDSVDTSEKSAVVDWYYKRGNILHYCKYVNDEVLYSSENDPKYAQRGWYDHGKYPFIFDKLFVEQGTPCGFGYVDIMKDTQMYIDKLNQVILKNALYASRARFIISGAGEINEKEFADASKDIIHVNTGKLGDDSFRQIITSPLSAVYPNILQMKIEELKETSGNRDFSQGSTASGVTAASAIAALQEAGSKLSRDMIKAAYRSHVQVNYLVIELIRQFYTEPRKFRITGQNGNEQFVSYDNAGIMPQQQSNDFGISTGERLPVFDIKVTSQKASPFSREVQNQRATEMYGAGFFNPQLADQALTALDMMDFEGKQAVVQKVSQGQTMFKMIQQLQMQVAQLGQMLMGQQPGGVPAPEGGERKPQGLPTDGNVEANGLGGAVDKTNHSQAEAMKRSVQNRANPG